MLPYEQTVKAILRMYLRVFSIRLVLSGYFPLPRGRKIIAANHTFASDALSIPLVLKDTLRFIVQGDLFQIPFLGNLLRGAGHIPVDPKDRHAAFDRACEALLRDETIVIFLEGKLVLPGERVKARTGVVRVSLATGAPIIPLGIHIPRADTKMIKLHWQGRVRQGLWQFKGTCNLRFGPSWKPDPTQQKPFQIHALTDDLMNQIYSLVAEAERESLCGSYILLNPILQ